MSLEPIRQVWGDERRSTKVTETINEIYSDWVFYSTPPFFFTDYHVQRRRANGRENYIGDLEIKWLNQPASMAAKFPFQKLQKIIIAPPYNDNAQHRICFRYNDGLLLIPAIILGSIMPEFTTRHDTGERDLNVIFKAEDYYEYWIDRIVND